MDTRYTLIEIFEYKLKGVGLISNHPECDLRAAQPAQCILELRKGMQAFQNMPLPVYLNGRFLLIVSTLQLS